jgi:ribonucleoside-diphosphate reductase alpha chain
LKETSSMKSKCEMTMREAEYPSLSPNAVRVLEKRYLARDETGLLTETPEALFRRVAKIIAEADHLYGAGEAQVLEAAARFEGLMRSLRFLPNSPTLTNAGKPHAHPQYSACFVIPIEDDMRSIGNAVTAAMLIHKTGGGTGFSFSRLRPKGDLVRSSGGVASGPVSFMRIFDAATEQVKQGSTRRGANMGILRVDHPDILEFIACKSQDGEIRNFNISVAVTDPFMEALERDAIYPLINPRTGEAVKTLPARQIWDLICEHAWRNGDPGLFFVDRANAACPIRHIGEIESTNPCGEVELNPWDACTLGSINLERHLVRNPVMGNFEIDWPALRETVQTAVHFLDNVIDANDHPLPEINEMTRKSRRIGLGIMGFARMLFALEIPYDSEAGLEAAAEVMGFIQSEGWKASEALARKRGVYPAWKGSRHEVEGKGVRNSYVTCIAPTGSISMIADTSGGCEPEFSLIWHKHVLDGENLPYVSDSFVEIAKREGWWDETLIGKILANHGSCRGLSQVPGKGQQVFAVAHDLSPEWHVRMQAAFQTFTDAAVSKTVNLPTHATIDDVKHAYLLAYRLGCKGITVYRDGSRAGQVLNVGVAESKESGSQGPADSISPSPALTRGVLLDLPDIVEEKRVRVRTYDGNAYIHIGFLDGEPAEIFAHPALGKYQGFIALACRLASTILRLGGTMEQILEQFYRAHREYGDVSTPILALMKGIQKVMAHTGCPVTVADRCPECGSLMRLQEGCMNCAACGYSRC